MTKWLLVPIFCGIAFSQNSFDKPPADVDDALKARINEFYKFHLIGKYRQAEQMVAEESKDAFYASGKPDIKEFQIGDVAYSDSYKKAKVTIVAKIQVSFLGAGIKTVTAPFPSNWEVEKGQWSFYYPHQAETPFGKASPKTTEMGKDSDASMAFQPVDLATVAHAVKVDRTFIKLGSPMEKVTISNGLPGNVTLSFTEKSFPGLDVTLDKTELKTGENAEMTVVPRPGGGKSRMNIEILVKPTNQVIEIQVK